MITIVTPSRTEIDVIRPDGTTETVDVTDRFPVINDAIFAEIRAVTALRGRGNVIAWRHLPAVTHDDHIDTCDRCTAAVDDRTAHARIVHIGHVPVKTLYCTTCAQIINAMRD